MEMSPVRYTFFLLASAITFNPFSDTFASTINALDVPLVVRNGTGPIDLSCIYDIRDNENGLVVKWYHDANQIYQWIPPMPPQDIGIISGFTEYPKMNIINPNSYSIIRLNTVTIEMSGEYTCTVSTFQEEDSRKTRMIVYVPERNLTIYAAPFNETHLNLTCIVDGARPRPIVRFYIEAVEVRVGVHEEKTRETDRYDDNLSLEGRALVANSFEPMLIECEVSIPNTDYRRRERTVYYPTRFLSQRSGATSGRSSSNVLVLIVLLHDFSWTLKYMQSLLQFFFHRRRTFLDFYTFV